MMVLSHLREEGQMGVAERRLSRRRSFRYGFGTDDRGWTALHIGARKGDVKERRMLASLCMEMVLPIKVNCSRLLTLLLFWIFLLSWFVRIITVKRLLAEGMDANVAAWGPKLQGVTPLHLAAEGGHIKVMDVLLERGANIDARTKGSCGWTPLHLAAKERSKKAVRFLVENGAFLPPDINDSRFNPPVHYCPGLEWAYDELKRLNESLSSSGDSSSGSET